MSEFLRVNTKTPEGVVTRHEVSRYGLHTVVIERAGSPPLVEDWERSISKDHVLLCTHTETRRAGVQEIHALFLYCKNMAKTAPSIKSV